MQMYSMCLDICSYKQKVQGIICWEGNHSCKLQPIFLLCQVIQIMLFPHSGSQENGKRLWLTVGFLDLAHHCPLSHTSMREGDNAGGEGEGEGRLVKGGREGEEWKAWGSQERKEQETWIGEGEEGRGNKRGGGSVREGGTKSWAMCQGLFHLCSPGLPELPPSLTSVISSMKRPLGGDGGLDSGFRLWPTPADAAKSSRTLLELIGCHFQVQGTRQFIFFLHFCNSVVFPQNHWKPENNSHESPEYYQAEKQDF